MKCSEHGILWDVNCEECEEAEKMFSNSALSGLVKLPDYEKAYNHAEYLMKYNSYLRAMERKQRPVNWRIIREMLAKAYISGVEGAI